jgi:hypothetical protein
MGCVRMMPHLDHLSRTSLHPSLFFAFLLSLCFCRAASWLTEAMAARFACTLTHSLALSHFLFAFALVGACLRSTLARPVPFVACSLFRSNHIARLKFCFQTHFNLQIAAARACAYRQAMAGEL